MDAFVAGTSAALGGAIGGLIGFSFAHILDWWRKPNLHIDFESFNDRKPFMHTMTMIDKETLEMSRVVPQNRKRALMKLSVCNTGKTVAMNCEVKANLFGFNGGIPRRLPWSGKLYWETLDTQLEDEIVRPPVPIHLNPRSSEEFLDLFRLDYREIEQGVNQRISAKKIDIEGLYICSRNPYKLSPNEGYKIEITASANNVMAKPVFINVMWDGTLAHFLKGECAKFASE